MRQVIRLLSETEGDVSVETYGRRVKVTVEIGTLKFSVVIPKSDAILFAGALVNAANGEDE